MKWVEKYGFNDGSTERFAFDVSSNSITSIVRSDTEYGGRVFHRIVPYDICTFSPFLSFYLSLSLYCNSVLSWGSQGKLRKLKIKYNI